MAAGRHLWFTKMLITSVWIELFWLKFELHIPWRNRNWKISSECEILKIQDGGRPPSWIYQNVNNFRMDWAFGCNLNCIYLHKKIGNSSEERNFEIQDGGRRHLWFTKMLITSVWIELFGWNLNCIYLGITEIGKFHQKCEILKIQMAAGRHLWFTKTLLIPHERSNSPKFQQHTPLETMSDPWVKSKFVNSKMAATAGWKSIVVIRQAEVCWLLEHFSNESHRRKNPFELMLHSAGHCNYASASPW